MNDKQDASFKHLQLAMARLDILLHRQIRRQQAIYQAVAEESWQSFHMSAQQAVALLQRPFAYGPPPLADETDQAYEQALAQAEARLAQFMQSAELESLRLYHLQHCLSLSSFEMDVLLLGLAAALDTRYAALFGFLHDDLTRKRPSVNLALDLFGDPSAGRLQQLSYFLPAAILRQQQLLHIESDTTIAPIQQSFDIDATLLPWLLSGHYEAQPPANAYLRYEVKPQPDLALLSPTLQPALTQAASDEAILILTGADSLAQQTAVYFIAQQRQQPLLTLNLQQAGDNIAAWETAVHRLLRDARLTNSLPCLTQWDICLSDEAPPASLLAALADFPDLLIISGQKSWQPREREWQRPLTWLTCSLPDYEQRQHLLSHFLGGVKTADLELPAIAAQFQLPIAQLRDLIFTAGDLARQTGQPLSSSHLFSAARAHSNPRLAALARKLEPRYQWPDLILPVEQLAILQELVATVRHRPQVLHQWGVGQKLVSSAGITVLFAGPPGTGKTMAAEVIAHELGLDLYKIDLSRLVSKYIGETEKNLERIFSEAESSNAILFFDEADAVFGKRSEVKDAHDRYANIEISYLLQRMESYDGITILATNLRANLDEAFTRRLQFAVDFPFPAAEDRLRIWQTLFPPDVPRADDLNLALLAKRFEFSGGSIRNIIVSATYLAASNGQVVTQEHLLRGTRRELQKMGRLISEGDLVIGNQ